MFLQTDSDVYLTTAQSNAAPGLRHRKRRTGLKHVLGISLTLKVSLPYFNVFTVPTLKLNTSLNIYGHVAKATMIVWYLFYLLL